MPDAESVSPLACPDCGHEPGARGRIRHDEFCPRRSKTVPLSGAAGGSQGQTSATGGAERRPRRRGFDSVKFTEDMSGGIGYLQLLIIKMKPALAGNEDFL